MSISTSLKARDDFSDSDMADLRQLADAVYPPGESAGASREWARPQWDVFVRDEAGTLVSHTGVVRRDGSVDGRPSVIGGIGGVATHPDQRGKGYASLGMGRALDFLAERGAEFALLVCRTELVDYYSRLGWRQFDGDLIVTQHGEPEKFTFNRVMVGDLAGQAPTSGTIDLEGPPW